MIRTRVTCPHCGEDEEYFADYFDGGGDYVIECPCCGRQYVVTCVVYVTTTTRPLDLEDENEGDAMDGKTLRPRRAKDRARKRVLGKNELRPTATDVDE